MHETTHCSTWSKPYSTWILLCRLTEDYPPTKQRSRSQDKRKKKRRSDEGDLYYSDERENTPVVERSYTPTSFGSRRSHHRGSISSNSVRLILCNTWQRLKILLFHTQLDLKSCYWYAHICLILYTMLVHCQSLHSLLLHETFPSFIVARWRWLPGTPCFRRGSQSHYNPWNLQRVLF